MEEIDIFGELEETMNALLSQNEGLRLSEIENFRNTARAFSDNIFSQSRSQATLSNSLWENHKAMVVHLTDVERINSEKVSTANIIDNIKSSNECIMGKLENLKSMAIEQQNEIQMLLKRNETNVQKIKDSVKHTQKSFDLYRKYYGLEIRPLKNQRIQFVFHNALSDSTDIIFVIVQLIDRIYCIQESEPTLNNLKQLEDLLNHTNDLAGFIQLVRKLLVEEVHKLEG